MEQEGLIFELTEDDRRWLEGSIHRLKNSRCELLKPCEYAQHKEGEGYHHQQRGKCRHYKKQKKVARANTTAKEKKTQ